ncbi:MAG: choline transporter [Rheinheimera sp.]|nr:MAG: choline transporter [Rheinheimera sp.]
MAKSRSPKQCVAFVLAALSLMPAVSQAELSSTVTLTSNYLFNGITLTDHDPALQPSLDWNNGSGFYAGLWASNVKFAPGTSLEFDATVGHWWQLNADWLLDAGIAQYTYHGSDGPQSRGFNFPEAYLKVSYRKTRLSYWYASDYFGAGGGHYIVALNHAIPLGPGELLLQVDRSTSTQTDKFMRDNDGTYHHWRLGYQQAAFGLNWILAFDDTDLELPVLGDARLSLSVSKTFPW